MGQLLVLDVEEDQRDDAADGDHDRRHEVGLARAVGEGVVGDHLLRGSQLLLGGGRTALGQLRGQLGDLGVEVVDEDRAEGREAERAPDLLHRVEHGRGDRAVLVRHGVHGGQGERHEDETQPEGEHDDPGQEVRGIRALGREVGEAPHAERGERGARARDPARVDLRDEPRGDLRGDDDADREGQEGQPRREGRVAEDRLDVDAEEVEHREHARADDEHDEVGRATGAVAGDAHRQQGVCHPRLDDDEGDEQQRAEGEVGDGRRVAPRRARCVGQTVDERGEADDRGDGARDVERAAAVLGLGEDALREERDEDADRQVDEEVPAPVDLGQRATEDEADGRSGAGHGGEDTHRLVALLAGREGRRDERERVGGGEGATEALDAAGDEHLRLGLGDARDERGEREERHAPDEHPCGGRRGHRAGRRAADATEGERVDGDDPLEVGLAEAEVLLDVGQGDVHDVPSSTIISWAAQMMKSARPSFWVVCRGR